MTYRIIVTGGRHFSGALLLNGELTKAVMAVTEPVVIVHGDATGADRLAKRWAQWASQGMSVTHEPHPANWLAKCRVTCKPGHRRQMATVGEPRHWNGSGWVTDSTYCPAAGNYRNEEMAELGADLCIAFPGGTGTADMVRRAKAHGIEVRDLRDKVVA